MSLTTWMVYRSAPSRPGRRDWAADRLAARTYHQGGVEERLVPVPLPDMLTDESSASPRPPFVSRRAVGEEKQQFLDQRQEQLRVPGERGVQFALVPAREHRSAGSRAAPSPLLCR